MKYLIILTLLVSCFGDNAKDIKDAETTNMAPEASEAPMDTESVEAEIPTDEDASDEAPVGNVGPQADTGFVEENDQCICTKEYDPVCGSNGQDYPSPCQAGCDKITDFTKGECE